MAKLFPSAGILNAFASRCGGCRTYRDLAYGPATRHKLDIYIPPPTGTPRPVIVFLYGGGWEGGDKATYLFVGAALATHGFVALIPDYRVYPEVRFPAFVEDAALALRWARDHTAALGGDPDRIVLAGHSAGAHIAAMLSFDRQWLARVGLDSRRGLVGLVGLAGPYDFLPLHSDTLREIFGPEDRLAASQPINFVDGTAPPAFLATGRTDRTVSPGNSVRLADRIGQMGGIAKVKIYPRVGHRAIIGAFSAPLRPLAPVLRDVARFIDDVTAETIAGAAAASARWSA